ncbi:hypothetical protein FI667_g11537, partial [Globisporangium splendens]
MDAASASDSSSLAEDSTDVAHGREASSPVVSTSSSSPASRNASGDTCAFYGLDTVEREPNGCVISSTGLCQSMSSYVASMDYRNTGLFSSGTGYNTTWDVSVGSSNIFPSTNTTYCEVWDDACTQCYAIAVNASRAGDPLASTTKYCVGRSGCVCIFACEPSVWRSQAAPACEQNGSKSNSSTAVAITPSPEPTPAADASTSVHYDASQIFLTLTQIVGVFVLIFIAVLQKAEPPQPLHRRRVIRSPRDHLRLSQWRAMQEELIEQEKEKPPEAPALAASTLDIERSTFSWKTTTHWRDPRRALSSLSMAAGSGATVSPSASSSSDDVQAPAAPDAGIVDLCRVKIVSETCREERSCFDCLNTPVAAAASAGGCFLNANSGQCQSWNQLSLSNETNVTTATTSSQAVLEQAGIYLPSTREYCYPLDSACILCSKVTNNAGFAPSGQESATMSTDKQVCFGVNGCICSVVCESFERMSITANRCPTTPAPSTANASASGFPSAQTLIISIGVVFLFVRCGVEYLRIWLVRRRLLRLRAPAGAYNNTQSLPQENQLRLSGWIAWHRELREREKHGDLEYIDLDTPKQRKATVQDEDDDDDDMPVANVLLWSSI